MSNGSNPLSIFRAYILKLNYFPTEVINRDIPNFDFILGFASEKGTGKFDTTWNIVDCSPQMVTELKESHPNVRVVLSIGGVKSEFDPKEPEDKWIDNAVSSIKVIINQYKIDGIDIHYDVIKTPVVVFASYIGEVIKQLKNDPELSIKVVSIAPTKNVRNHYHTLYSNNRDNIDWVDYRFYDQILSSAHEFTNSYHKEKAAYDAGKFLAGISYHPDPRIYNAIKSLIQNNLMPSVFVWKADDFAAAPDPFCLQNL